MLRTEYQGNKGNRETINRDNREAIIEETSEDSIDLVVIIFMKFFMKFGIY